MTSKPITPEMMAASGSEDGQQLAIMLWAALNLNKYPELKWLHHSPNGGFRNPKEATKLKAMGVKKGFPDLNLLVKRGKFSGLFIELKTLKDKNTKSKGLRQEQNEWIDFLQSQGYGAMVCHGWEEAVKIIQDYLEWK